MESTAVTSFAPLHIAIVGCGIGGLAAAIALRHQGHYVTVYERSHFASEVGASITVAANATKFLEQWGVDTVAARSVI
jgi:salicylate hydroxylase